MKKIMIQHGTNFDKNKDIQEVDQFGFVDLVKSMQNGYVPGDVEYDVMSFNDIDDPASIVGKPKDCFEAMRMQDMIVSHAQSVRETASAKKSVSSETEN